jgi:hypothetical protein
MRHDLDHHREHNDRKHAEFLPGFLEIGDTFQEYQQRLNQIGAQIALFRGPAMEEWARYKQIKTPKYHPVNGGNVKLDAETIAQEDIANRT